MASRRNLRKRQAEEEPPRRRRSLRLLSQKAEQISYQRSLMYQKPTTSAFMDFATPRTVFKKVLQTQPVVSPLLSEETDSPKSSETVFHVPRKASPSTNLEVTLPDSTQRDKSRIVLHATRSRKVRLSAFERDLNKQLHSSTAQGLLDATYLTKSLQISLSTPAPLTSAGKKGLIRRPKSYRGFNVKDFEGGLEQDLLQIKDAAENDFEDLQAATLLSNDTEAHSAEAEVLVQSHPSEENGAESSLATPEPVSARPSLGSRSVLPIGQTPLARQDETSDMEVERVAESGQKKILSPRSKSALEIVTAPAEKAGGYKEGRESPQGAGKGLVHMLATETLSPGPEDAISQKRIVTPQREPQKRLHAEEVFSPKVPLNADVLEASPVASKNGENVAMVLEMDPGQGVGAVRSSTPRDAASPRASRGHLSTFLSQRFVRRSVNEMVTSIIRELDEIVPTVADQNVAEVSLEEGFSPSESAADLSQRLRVGTPQRQASEKTAKQLKETLCKEVRDGATPPMGDEKRRKTWNLETEQLLGFETENNSGVEEMPESEDAEPTGRMPAFVHAKAFHCTPLMSSSPVSKVVDSRSPVKQSLVQRVPKPAKRACRKKQEPSLPTSLVKKMFTHYVRMPVAKDALEAVQRCVKLYFKNLSNDLEAYVSHAKRKTAEPADLELLMRRQGLVTDKMPLNVLVEQHLPMEYRKLLIPVATSGNKVVPDKPQ